MWDIQADGYARGDGVAAVVLKTLSAALADGDHIECLIRETSVNQDGRTRGITMPSSEAQTRLIQDTYARAGLDPMKPQERCQYFEAHGKPAPTVMTTSLFAERSRNRHPDWRSSGGCCHPTSFLSWR